MPSAKVEIQCEKGHYLFYAYYRDSKTLCRIDKLYYCPKCNEFYKAGSKKIQVALS